VGEGWWCVGLEVWDGFKGVAWKGGIPSRLI